MTYNVFGRTLNLAQPTSQHVYDTVVKMLAMWSLTCAADRPVYCTCRCSSPHDTDTLVTDGALSAALMLVVTARVTDVCYRPVGPHAAGRRPRSPHDRSRSPPPPRVNKTLSGSSFFFFVSPNRMQ